MSGRRRRAAEKTYAVETLMKEEEEETAATEGYVWVVDAAVATAEIKEAGLVRRACK